MTSHSIGRIRRVGVAMTLLAAITGCAMPSLRRATPGDAATAAAANAASWATTLLAAHRDVDRGRHGEADRTLREFAERAPASPEAVETLYWRALIMLDPTSRTGSAREAAAMLEKYLASDAPLTHRTEAGMLHRVASSLVASSTAKPAMSEAEVKALKDELEQAKAELERIRRRLVAPPPTTPPPVHPSTDAE